MAVTWASRMTAFLGSVTRPVTDALVDCACSVLESRAHNITARITLRMEILMYSPQAGFDAHASAHLRRPQPRGRNFFIRRGRRICTKSIKSSCTFFTHVFVWKND